MASLTKTFISLLVVFCLIYECTCIHCYYCNSANNSACLDVNEYEDEIRSRIIPVVHCETAIPSNVALNFFCRKITQTIFHPHKDSEVRVTRGCGWVRHHKECYKDDNSDHLGTTCQCFQDLCNGSHRIDVGLLYLMLPVVMYFWC
ncbi:uncharacterized protein LOC121726468 [Aricia agestis]|uniref:uncharacterized protein LOC121726468 n=1 Tax=Aricia agestis TaxID=91739 RepID=UPI001C2026CB|nr:uncharacterized protein LOC121726468 [Aricia agestis]